MTVRTYKQPFMPSPRPFPGLTARATHGGQWQQGLASHYLGLRRKRDSTTWPFQPLREQHGRTPHRPEASRPTGPRHAVMSACIEIFTKKGGGLRQSHRPIDPENFCETFQTMTVCTSTYRCTTILRRLDPLVKGLGPFALVKRPARLSLGWRLDRAPIRAPRGGGHWGGGAPE